GGMEQVGKSDGLCFVGITRQVRNFGSELEPKHQAESAHALEGGRILLSELLKTGFQEVTHLTRVCSQSFALNNLQDFQRDRATQRRTAVGRAMRAGGE